MILQILIIHLGPNIGKISDDREVTDISWLPGAFLSAVAGTRVHKKAKEAPGNSHLSHTWTQ